MPARQNGGGIAASSTAPTSFELWRRLEPHERTAYLDKYQRSHQSNTTYSGAMVASMFPPSRRFVPNEARIRYHFHEALKGQNQNPVASADQRQSLVRLCKALQDTGDESKRHCIHIDEGWPRFSIPSVVEVPAFLTKSSVHLHLSLSLFLSPSLSLSLALTLSLR